MDRNSKVSICFTTYNRTDMLYDAVLPFILDERVGEIIISDDCSNENVFNNILWKYTGVSKIQIFRNEVNLDCFKNKRQAVKRASNDWVALLDSDNLFDKTFLDVLFNIEWEPSIVYAPEFAKPHFNFTGISGQTINRNNISTLINSGNCSTMLNAMNYFVNRDEFLRVWDGSVDPVTSDSLYHNYNWLKAGNSIYVTPGLQYEHRIHEGSHYRNNVMRTPHGFHEEMINKLKRL